MLEKVGAENVPAATFVLKSSQLDAVTKGELLLVVGVFTTGVGAAGAAAVAVLLSLPHADAKTQITKNTAKLCHFVFILNSSRPGRINPFS